MLLFEIEIKRAAVPDVVYLLKVYCSMMQTSFQDSRSGLTNLLEAERIPWHPAFIAVPFVYCFRPTSFFIFQRICVYMHTSVCEQTVYELTLLPNGTVSETFWHKSRAV
jgi:hypothetical protein